MTPRVWVERPITSVEDAEGLPANAIAICPGDHKAAMTERLDRDGRRLWTLTEQDEVSVSSRAIIGWTALVPIEAVEQVEVDAGEVMVRMGVREGEQFEPGDSRLIAAVDVTTKRRRLVTEWEDA